MVKWFEVGIILPSRSKGKFISPIRSCVACMNIERHRYSVFGYLATFPRTARRSVPTPINACRYAILKLAFTLICIKALSGDPGDTARTELFRRRDVFTHVDHCKNNPHTMSQSASSTASEADAVFDVRAIPGRVKHAQIFQRWSDLQVGQFFILLNDHDPVPLRYQFEGEFANAYSWEYLERGPEEFRVKITKLKPTAPASFAAPAARPAGATAAPTTAVRAPSAGTVKNVQEIDVRGFEPPEPLVRILDALESLPAGFTLRATTDREPCHLFGEAEQRGFRHDCHEQPDGSWITALTRA